jgi:hypothetical protein
MVVCSFWEAVAGSLSVATTAVSSAKVAVKEYNKVQQRDTTSNSNIEILELFNPKSCD